MPTEKVEHQWPAYFPPDCPPGGAVASVREVFRFVEQDPPKNADFVPWLLLRPDSSRGRECEAAGLSVFTDLADAARQRRRFKGFRHRVVAKGTIQPVHGVTMPTPRENFLSHVTWWQAVDVAAETLFVVVQESPP